MKSLYECIISLNESSTLKDEYDRGNKKIKKFNNIFKFMDFCKKKNLTEENSETYMEDNCMYIKY